MASKRKYRPRNYERGGAVIPAPEVEATADVPAPAIDEPPKWGSAPDANHAVRAALDATVTAEALNHASPEQMIAAMFPDLSPAKVGFLAKHPEILTDPIRSKAANRAYHDALADGIADDSDEIHDRMLASAAAPMVSRDPSELTRLVARDAADRGHDAAPMALDLSALDLSALDLSAPAPPPRRSVPMTAPVSRNVPSMSGQRAQDFRQIVLSGQEREIAKLSYHWLSQEAAEHEYATQKAKLMRARADGSYPERERN